MRKKKKRKERRHPVNPLAEPRVREPGFRILNRVACVQCYMDNQLKPLSVCKNCEHHMHDKCSWAGDRFRVKVVSASEPMRFNRTLFSVSSEHIRDESRNYYFTTEIMQPMKRIKDCREYLGLKDALLSGAFSDTEEHPERTAALDKVIMTLGRAESVTDAVYIDNGLPLKEQPVKKIRTDALPVKFYLYDMYSMGGLADVQIDRRYYKVRHDRIPGAVESLIMVQDGEMIHIGHPEGRDDDTRFNRYTSQLNRGQ